MAAIRHRGPDGAGYYDADWYSFGHVRLSIVDLRTGAQPLISEDNRLQLIANGEVYNHQEIRSSSQNSILYKTGSDCEAILQSYAEYGETAFERLNGMFAFALADRQAERIYLVVDSGGIKPLYVYRSGSFVLFSSELRGIVAALRELGEEVAVNAGGCRKFLRNGWFSNTECLIEGVERLTPGCKLLLDRNLELSRNSVRFAETDPQVSSENQQDSLEHELTSAIQRQMMADVPVGFFLSGGIDSSLLVALAKKNGIDARTFTVDFIGSTEADLVSEGRIARDVAERLGCSHSELQLSPANLLSRLDDTIESMDEPIADPAILAFLVLCEFAREQVKVCISGDGGDELFYGYARHRIEILKRHLGLLDSLVRRIAALTQSYRVRTAAPRKMRQLALAADMLASKEFVYGPFSGASGSYLHAHTEGDEDALDSLVGAENIDEHVYYRELRGPLSGQMLTKTDRASMWAGLEVRVPFLDHRFVSQALLVPRKESINWRQGKLPLRKLLARHVPPQIAGRRKHGFRVPISGWFKNDLGAVLREEFQYSYEIPESVISKSSAMQLLDKHVAGAEEHSIRLWALLCLNRKIRCFL